jgi:2-iminoacetate synthase ThiH
MARNGRKSRARASRLGLKQYATMLYGHIETAAERGDT